MATFTLHSPTAAVPTRTQALEHVSTTLSLAGEALAGFDWLALRLSNVYAGAGIPRGDGSAVVLVPGMLASNASMLELRSWLRRVGYRPYFAELRRNDGCPEQTLDLIADAVDRAFAETGQGVHVIGHSLGGLLARGAAMARPGKVASVVTLGSPVNGVRVHPAVALSGALFMKHGACDGSCVAALQRPLPANVRETSIYSKSDGIVEWQTCFGDRCDAVEVNSSHIGLVANADAYRAMANALAKPAQAPSRPTSAVLRTTVPAWMSRTAA